MLDARKSIVFAGILDAVVLIAATMTSAGISTSRPADHPYYHFSIFVHSQLTALLQNQWMFNFSRLQLTPINLISFLNLRIRAHRRYRQRVDVLMALRVLF